MLTKEERIDSNNYYQTLIDLRLEPFDKIISGVYKSTTTSEERDTLDVIISLRQLQDVLMTLGALKYQLQMINKEVDADFYCDHV